MIVYSAFETSRFAASLSWCTIVSSYLFLFKKTYLHTLTETLRRLCYYLLAKSKHEKVFNVPRRKLGIPTKITDIFEFENLIVIHKKTPDLYASRYQYPTI